MSTHVVPAGRAHQLDALRLDDDATKVLLNETMSALQHIGDMREWRDQIVLLLRTVIFLHTTAQGRPTPALTYMSLRYNNATSRSISALSIPQRFGLFLGLVYVPFASSRVRGRKRAIFHVLRVIVLILFHCRSDYRNLIERLCRVNVIYTNNHGPAATPLELLNRTHVWRGLAHTALAITPLLHALPLPWFLASNAPDSPKCPICADLELSMPHRALPCDCLFCYTCIATRIEAGTFKCPRCRVIVDRLIRVTN